MLELLKKNIGNSIGIRVGSEYIQPYSSNWYILPFTDDKWLRVVALSTTQATRLPYAEISDIACDIDGSIRTIQHFKIESITSFWIL